MTQTSPIAAIEVFGNRSTPTEVILKAFGKQPGDAWEFSDYHAVANRVVNACGLRDLTIMAAHYPPNKGVFITLDVIEADAPLWQWRAAPREALTLPAEIGQAVEQCRTRFNATKFAGGFTMRRVDGGRMRNDDAETGQAEDRLAALVAQHHDALIAALLRAQDASVRTTAAEALAQASNSQPLIDALSEALRDPNQGVRQHAANALQLRIWTVDPHVTISPDRLIPLLDAPTDDERRSVGFMLDALAIDDKRRAYIRQHAEARLRELARPDGPSGANFAQRLLNRFTLDDAENIQIDAAQARLLADTISAFASAQSLAEAQAEIDSDPIAPAHVAAAARPYPGSFTANDQQPLQRLRQTIILHTVTPTESGRYRVLARRTFADNHEIPPFSGELRWDGTRWWLWHADA